jgi:hypothetical protein
MTAFLIALATSVSGCGREEPKSDPAAIDAHLKQAVAREEAERQRLVAEARVREEARMHETEQNAQNYAETPD